MTCKKCRKRVLNNVVFCLKYMYLCITMPSQFETRGLKNNNKKTPVIFTIIFIVISIFVPSKASALNIEQQDFSSLGIKESQLNNNLIEKPIRLVENIDLQSAALLTQVDPGYSSTQGMCVVEDRYVVVGRYRTDGAKDLMVYDVIDKTIKASNVFMKTDSNAPDAGTNVDLEHINGMTYWDGGLYIPRSTHRDIIRLKFNQDCSIEFDSIVFESGKGAAKPSNISCSNGIFYWTASGRKNQQFYIYRSTDSFQTTELAFVSDFGGLVKDNAIVKQGMSSDSNYLYFAFSGRLGVPEIEGTDYQRLMRNTEKIIITKLDGEIVRTFSFPRGSYGEIEDVDTIVVNNSTYLIVSCNRNDDGVACVYAVPLYMNTVPSADLETTCLNISLYYNKREFLVYCDNTACYTDGVYNLLNANPFASGLTQDRFTDVYAALSFVKRLGVPAKLILTGDYEDLVFKNLPSGIAFVFDDAHIKSAKFEQCHGITISGKNDAVLEHLSIEESIVLITPGISMINIEDTFECAIEADYSLLTGSVNEMKGYKELLMDTASIVNISSAS